MDVYVASDRETGRSRGFAFVTFASEEEASKAIRMFNGVEFEGRALNINEARERDQGGPERRGPRRPMMGGGGRPPPRGGPRPFAPAAPPALEEDFHSDEFRAYDQGEFERDKDMDTDWSEGDGDKKQRGGRKRPKTKGSRRRLRARKRDF